RHRGPASDDSVVHISGCQSHEFSYDANFNGTPFGAMTYHLMDAYNSLARGSTIEELYRRLRIALPSRRYPQTPCLKAEGVGKGWFVPGFEPEQPPVVDQPTGVDLDEVTLTLGGVTYRAIGW